ncbi:MAG: PsbP-related protein [Candidatus Nitrosocosmicus sp.]
MHIKPTKSLNYKYGKKISVLITISILILQFNSIVNNNNPNVLGLLFFNDQKQPVMLTYENNSFNFKINYPNNWERSVKINNEITFIAPKESDTGSSPAGLVIKVVPLQLKNVSVESVSNALISQLKKEHKDFKLESSSQFNLDGKNGKQIIFTATDNNLQNRKAIQTITIDRNNIIIITYKASIDKYTQYENVIKDMISSFKFLYK